MAPRLSVVGDGIENPLNAQTLVRAAEMFGCACLFRDRKALKDQSLRLFPNGPPLSFTSTEELVVGHAPIIACDNGGTADEIYGFRLPSGPRSALIVGNERHGIAQISWREPTVPCRYPCRRRDSIR